jgi:hypothetical protein
MRDLFSPVVRLGILFSVIKSSELESVFKPNKDAAADTK